MSLTSRAVHSSSAAISSGGRLAAELLDELALDVHDLVQLLHHVHRDADRARLVGDRARHRLADPPGRVGRELVAAPVVELLDGADQPERTLLDQVQERQAAAEVALGDRDDQPQVGLDHVLLGGHVAALDALGERRPPVGGEQVHAADRAQVEAQRVEARLDGQVDLRLLRRRRDPSRRRRGSVARRPACRPGDTISMPCSTRCGAGPDLLLRDLDLLETGRDLLERQVAALACPRSTSDAQLLDLEERRVAASSEQCYSLVLCAQPHSFQPCASRRPEGGSCRPDSRYVGYVRGVCREGLSQSDRAAGSGVQAAASIHPIRADLPQDRMQVSSERRNERTDVPSRDDVQARRPTTHVSLSRVGVTGVEKVVRIQANGRRAALLRRARVLRRSRAGAEGRAHVALRGDRERGDRRGRARRGLQGGDAGRAHRRARARPPGRPARRGDDRGALPRAQARARLGRARRRRSTRCSARRWRRSAARAGWSACRPRA